MTCDCSICLYPDEHEARKKITDDKWAAWVYRATVHREGHDNPETKHKAPQPGCVFCEGTVRLNIYGLPNACDILNPREKKT